MPGHEDVRREIRVGTSYTRGVGVNAPVHPVIPFQRRTVALCDRSLASKVRETAPLLAVRSRFRSSSPRALVMDGFSEEFDRPAIRVKGYGFAQEQLNNRPCDPVRVRGAARNIN